MITSNIFLTPTEVGVTLKDGYNDDLSSRDAGRIGGNMVKKMIQQAQKQHDKQQISMKSFLRNN